MTYFTSDLHFGHANIMKFHPNFRKFQNINDMDNTLIRLWNSRVNPCDEVYNLGDVSFHKDFEQTLKNFKTPKRQARIDFRQSRPRNPRARGRAFSDTQKR